MEENKKLKVAVILVGPARAGKSTTMQNFRGDCSSKYVASNWIESSRWNAEDVGSVFDFYPLPGQNFGDFLEKYDIKKIREGYDALMIIPYINANDIPGTLSFYRENGRKIREISEILGAKIEYIAVTHVDVAGSEEYKEIAERYREAFGASEYFVINPAKGELTELTKRLKEFAKKYIAERHKAEIPV